MTRKIIAGEFMALDGVLESPDKWSMPYFNDEVGAIIGTNMERSDAMLMGRRTYEEWAAYWPGKTAEDDEFAPYINSVAKFVVSTTLTSVEWEGTTLLNGDFREDITKLKHQPGKDIAVSGSITLVSSLLREGLLDELSLLVSPIVVGAGKRLFEDPSGPVGLKLIESRTLSNGVVALTYGLAEA
ncbi:MAG TPA: dihydrofolate reductase family protein [Actinomycetota bacterium]|nr:dihydrofolate reductase family protein [Actinomycetota bacterium]